MNRVLAVLMIIGYVVLCALLMFWWAPNFFLINTHLLPQLNYRYVAATGIPLGMLLMTLAARQSLIERFSFFLLLQGFVAALLLYRGPLSFYFPPQANFFCAAHLAVCGAGLLWNFFAYRRQVKVYEKRKAALNA